MIASTLTAAWRFSLVCLYLCVLFVAAFLGRLILSHAKMQSLIRLVYRLGYRVCGVRVQIIGSKAQKASLLVANHVSYMDILILGFVTQAAFIAKSGIKSWPIIGYAAKIMDTFFVSRSRSTLIKEIRLLRQRVSEGKTYILFPEGTSNDGVRLESFKSSFFQMLGVDKETWVQPLSVRIASLNGLPVRTFFKKSYSWRGDWSLMGHLWFLCQLGRFDIQVIFHQPLDANKFQSRGALTNALEQEVARGIES